MKCSVLSILFTILLLTEYSATLNILGIFPYQGKSHFLVFRVFLQELARRGHNVTVISHFPETNPPPNYHDISLAGTLEAVSANIPFENSYITVLAVGIFLPMSGAENCKVMLENKQVRNLITEKAKFNVIVLEQFNSDCALGVAHKLQAPVVGMTSHILMPFHFRRFGIAYNPAYEPFHFLGGGTKPSLYQRVERVLFDIYCRTSFYLLSQRADENTLAQYYDDIPPLEQLAGEIKFLLYYNHFILSGSRLYSSNVIEVGGYHVSSPKPLPSDLKKFLDDAEHGVIYISFGSTISPETMPADKLQAIVQTMKTLPQRFIWKWDHASLVINKDKLYTASWLPQVDILAHPKTVAFLSHAGNGGTTEAIYFGVPMIAMPVLGDQPANAAAIEESGLGIQLHIRDLNAENLINTFKKVLEPKFNQQVKKLSAAWHDRPLSPLDTAVYWTEFAAKHSNFTFRSAAATTPLYQYLNLDVYIILISIVSLIVSFNLILFKMCCRKSTKENINKKKKSKRN